MGKAVFPTQSLLHVGKVASEASRIGFERDEKERERSSQAGDIRPEYRCASLTIHFLKPMSDS